jgi:hypothetical protein
MTRTFEKNFRKPSHVAALPVLTTVQKVPETFNKKNSFSFCKEFLNSEPWSFFVKKPKCRRCQERSTKKHSFNPYNPSSSRASSVMLMIMATAKANP